MTDNEKSRYCYYNDECSLVILEKYGFKNAKEVKMACKEAVIQAKLKEYHESIRD